MHKEQFIKYLAKKNRRSQQFYKDALSEIFDGIRHHLAEGKDISFIGFGTFSAKTHKGGSIMHIKTKQKISYQSARRVLFRAGALLKKAVQKKLPSSRKPSRPNLMRLLRGKKK